MVPSGIRIVSKKEQVSWMRFLLLLLLLLSAGTRCARTAAGLELQHFKGAAPCPLRVVLVVLGHLVGGVKVPVVDADADPVVLDHEVGYVHDQEVRRRADNSADDDGRGQAGDAGPHHAGYDAGGQESLSRGSAGRLGSGGHDHAGDPVEGVAGGEAGEDGGEGTGGEVGPLAAPDHVGHAQGLGADRVGADLASGLDGLGHAGADVRAVGPVVPRRVAARARDGHVVVAVVGVVVQLEEGVLGVVPHVLVDGIDVVRRLFSVVADRVVVARGVGLLESAGDATKRPILGGVDGDVDDYFMSIQCTLM